MNKQNVLSIACAFVVVLGVSVFLFAQTSVTPDQEVDHNKAMLQALQALTAAQERQAADWEMLAKKGWPTPQNNTFTGNFPASMSIGISRWPSSKLRLGGSVGTFETWE